MIKDQSIFPLVIILPILIIFFLGDVLILLGEKLIDVVHSWDLFAFQSAQPANIDMTFPKEDVCTLSVLCVNTNSAAVATILSSITTDRYFLTCCVHALSKLIRLIRHSLNHTLAKRYHN